LKVCPAIVIVPFRELFPGLLSTVNVIEPVPFPLVGVTFVIHKSLLVAVQAQPGAVVTTTGPPAPPLLRNDWLTGAIENVQAAAACVTAKSSPAIFIVPDRFAPELLSTT
jgi:hypothetical protein